MIKKIAFFAIVAAISYLFYWMIWGNNVHITPAYYTFYLKKELSIDAIADSLKSKKIITSQLSLKLLSKIKSTTAVHPGLHEIKRGWSNLQILEELTTPRYTDVIKLIINPIRSREALISELARQTKINKEDLWRLLLNKEYTSVLGGFEGDDVFAVFKTGIYVLPKKITTKEFLTRIHNEYFFFWDEARRKKCADINLTPTEVTTLASMVYCETKINDEWTILAGVYINRLQREMPLNCPSTLSFIDKNYHSSSVVTSSRDNTARYNTVKNKGLPPGPICSVPPAVIDQVLDYRGHDFLYYCNDPKIKGGHLFADSEKKFEEMKKNIRDTI